MAADEIHLRAASPAEAGFLTGLAIRSKAYWGYPPQFIDACRAELAVSSRQMNNGGVQYIVAEVATRVVGFYGLGRLSDTEFELEALFVEPARIGKGIGRALIQHALAAVAAGGRRTLIVQGDPNAERFYRVAGGVPSGTRESGSIPGRYLPLFTIPVTDASEIAARRS